MPADDCSPPCRGWKWRAVFDIQRSSPRGRASFHPSPFLLVLWSDGRDVHRPCLRGQAILIFLAAAFGTTLAPALRFLPRGGRIAAQPVLPRYLPPLGFGFAVVVRQLDMADQFRTGLLLDPA